MSWIRVYCVGCVGLLSLMTLECRAETEDSRRTPEDELRTFVLEDPGLGIELVSSEPAVQSPVAFAWDSSHRLYVAEMIGYPQTGGMGRVTRLEDRDGDGRYETNLVFADGLEFPTSVLPLERGVLVTDAPHLWLLQDTDGDGVADQRRIVWTGFHPGSQQLRANALHWGPDNWIHGANGRNDGEIRLPEGGQPVSIRARDFRFRLDPPTFESVVGQSQFGQVHDELGRRFLSWNTIPLRQQVLPNALVEICPELVTRAVVDVAATGETGEVFPLSPPPRQFNGERASFYNALSGLTILKSPYLGDDSEGDAFVGESLSNLVIRRKLEQGTIVARARRTTAGREFLASTDGWFHPVFLATGPDGALYIADFYRPLVEHPIYVASDEARQSVDWREGAGRGRIWRVIRREKGVPCSVPAPPSDLSLMELVGRLSHEVGWQRETAQRLLVEGRHVKATEAVRELVKTGATPQVRLHALWTLDGLGGLDDRDLDVALADPVDQVRAAGVALSEARVGTDPRWSEQWARLVGDPSPVVRLQLAASARLLPAEDQFGLLMSLMSQAADETPLAEVALALAARSSGNRLELVSRLMERDPAVWLGADFNRGRLLLETGRSLGVGPMDEQEVVGIQALIDRARQAGQFAGVGWILAGLSERWARDGRSLKDRPQWRDPGFVEWARQRFDSEHRVNPRMADSRDGAAPLGLLAWGEPAATLPEVASLLERREPAAVQTLAASVVVALVGDAQAAQLTPMWLRAGNAARRRLWEGGRQSQVIARFLLDGVEQGVVSAAEFPIDLAASYSESQFTELREIVRLSQGPVETDRRQVVEQHRALLSRRGNSLKGARLFRTHCQVCHQIQRQGGTVGPDLSGIGGRPRDSLLVDLLDPNRQVNPNYVVQSVELKSGRVRSGIVEAETDRTLALKGADGQTELILMSEVLEVRGTGQSLMPEGFERKLPEMDLVDLLEFLREPRADLLQEAGLGDASESIHPAP